VLGLVGVALRLSFAPVVVLIAFAVALRLSPQHSFEYQGRGHSGDAVFDAVMAAALLAYVVGHYRMVSLTKWVFPPDPKRFEPRKRGRSWFARLGAKNRVVKQRRPGSTVSKEEIGAVLLVLPLWVLAGLLVRFVIGEAEEWAGPLRPVVRRGMMAAWLF